MDNIKSLSFTELEKNKKVYEGKILQIDKEIAFRNSQQKNNKHVMEKIFIMCNESVVEKFKNLPITIRGGKWKPFVYNFSYDELSTQYTNAVSAIYAYGGKMYKGFLFDNTEMYYLMGTDDTRHIITSDKNSDTYLLYVLFKILLKGDASNYKNLPEEFFPIQY